MDRCPYCGKERGVYTTYIGKQYYAWDGEPVGFNADVPDSKTAHCIDCGHKIQMKRLLKDREKN